MVQLGTNGGSHLIAVRDVAKTYRRGSEELHVLQGVNLAVDKGDFVAFMGPSGSGKTTLLNLLGGLDVPSAGSITVAGDEISRMNRRRWTYFQISQRAIGPAMRPTTVNPRRRTASIARSSCALNTYPSAR